MSDQTHTPSKQYCEWFDLGTYYLTDWTAQDILDVLEGRVAFDDVSPEAQAAAQREFESGAKEVLQLPDKDARRAALATLPPLVKEKMQKEILKLWDQQNA